MLATFGVLLGALLAQADTDASQGGLVPLNCQGGAGQPCPCTLCDLYELGKRIINFLLYAVSIPIAALAFLYGGVRMLTSQGNPNAITEGKAAITNAVIGLALAFFAWIILSTILTTLGYGISGVTAGNIFSPLNCHPSANSCNREFPAVPPPEPIGPPATGGSDAQVWNELFNGTNGNIDRNRGCDEAANFGTCVGGLSQASIQGIIDLENACRCTLTITGGSEFGGPGGTHDCCGPGTHPGGDKVDYARGGNLDIYIRNNAQPAGVRGDGATLYRIGNVIYADEGNHWDVCYANC